MILLAAQIKDSAQEPPILGGSVPQLPVSHVRVPRARAARVEPLLER